MFRKFSALIVTAMFVYEIGLSQNPENTSNVNTSTIPERPELNVVGKPDVNKPATTKPDINLPDTIVSLTGAKVGTSDQDNRTDSIIRSRHLPEPYRSSWHVPIYPNATFIGWDTGMVSAFGASNSLSGLMGVETGGLALTQNFGRLTLGVYGVAEKYGWYNNLSTTWGFGGTMSVTLNDHLSLHAFGSYQTPVRGVMPAMVPYMSTSTFGGFMRWKSSGIFGIDVGAQSQYNPSLRHWQTAPIVRPFVEISPGNRLGIDVGGILYQIFESANGYGVHNPTIAPDVPRLIVR